MNKFVRTFLFALAALLLLGAQQSPDDDVTIVVQAGFDAYVAQEGWIPLRVTVSNDSQADINGELRVSAPGLGDVSRCSRPIELPRGSRKEVFLYVWLEGYISALEVTLVVSNRPIAQERAPVQSLSTSDWLIGVISDAPHALNTLSDLTPGDGQSYLALLSLEDLPPVAIAWDALDILVIGDVDTGPLSEAQRQALTTWINDGGQLIIIGGTSYQRTFSGLGDLVPLRPAGVSEASLMPLAEYVGQPFAQAAPTDAPIVNGSPTNGAQALILSGGMPLVVSQERGIGQVILLTADPALEPLRSWDGVGILWQVLVGRVHSLSSWLSSTNTNWYSAHSAVAQIPGISLPSVLSLCLYSALYVALIGPVNYLVLRALRRLELAWATVPILVLVFSGLAYVSGLQLRGVRAVIHRLAVVQVSPESERAHVDALVGLWSPRRARYDLELGEGFLARSMPSDFGGLGIASDHSLQQHTDTEAMIPDVRVDVGAVVPFVIEGYADASVAPAIQSDLTLRVTAAGALSISGHVTNVSDHDLKDVAVLALNTVHYLGTLPAGAGHEVDLIVQRDRATSSSPPSVQPYYYGAYGYEYYDLPSQMMGDHESCYSYGRNDKQRQCTILETLIYSGGLANWSQHVYLVAWDERPLLPVEVSSAAYEPIDLTVYFIRLPCELGEQITQLPPGLTMWTFIPDSVASLYPQEGPYDFLLDPDTTATFRFEPLPDIDVLPDLDTLIVHLEGVGLSPQPPLTLALWNWEAGRYTSVPPIWGDLTIRQAGPFISDAGVVLVSVGGQGEFSIHIYRLDVTLASSSEQTGG